MEGLADKVIEGNFVGLKHFIETGEVFKRIKKSGGDKNEILKQINTQR